MVDGMYKGGREQLCQGTMRRAQPRSHLVCVPVLCQLTTDVTRERGQRMLNRCRITSVFKAFRGTPETICPRYITHYRRSDVPPHRYLAGRTLYQHGSHIQKRRQRLSIAAGSAQLFQPIRLV